MISSLQLIFSFLKTDIKIQKKYPSRLVFSLFQVFLMIFLFYFISQTLGTIPLLSGSYFPFVASGLAYQIYFTSVINASREKLMEYRDYGLLEEILFSQYPPWRVLLSVGFFNVLQASVRALLIVAAVAFAFPLNVQILPLLSSLVYGFLLAWELSFITSCSFLLWKRFSLLEIGGSIITLFLSGIYFPLSVLPEWLQKMALYNPLYQVMGLFRFSLGISSNSNDSMTSFNLLIPLLGLLVFNFVLYKISLKKIKRLGIISHF